MDRKIASHEADALRVEALEARRLAETLGDSQAICDLQNYAAELEAEAAQIDRRFTADPVFQRKFGAD